MKKENKKKKIKSETIKFLEGVKARDIRLVMKGDYVNSAQK